MSIKYNPRKEKITAILRYILLIVIIILFIPTDLYTGNNSRNSEIRIGYFADIITKDSMDLATITNFEFTIKNCRIYLLENKDSDSQIDLYLSSNRDTTMDVSKVDTTQLINIESSTGLPYGYLEVKIPGGVSIPKLTFILEGSKSEFMYDYKGDSTWETPMIIELFEIYVKDSNPVVKFKHPHEIDFHVTGSFGAGTFSNVKIQSFYYLMNVGSLDILQNSLYTENKLYIATPDGLFGAAGKYITSDDTNCPTDDERQAGLYGTSIDTTSMGISEMYVCSDYSSDGPTPDTNTNSSQASFSITQYDGPVQFLIDGSSSTQYNTYTPYTNSFAKSSQAILQADNEDYSTQPTDTRLYIYKVVSPGYEKLWVHAGQKQYIEARPWVISIMSLSILRPTYIT